MCFEKIFVVRPQWVIRPDRGRDLIRFEKEIPISIGMTDSMSRFPASPNLARFETEISISIGMTDSMSRFPASPNLARFETEIPISIGMTTKDAARLGRMKSVSKEELPASTSSR